MNEKINPQDCCGCTACVSICTHDAISMHPDKEGFLYPVVNTDICVSCGLCESVCPVLNRNKVENSPNQIAYKALRIKDKNLLKKSSSGGAFIVVATYVINNGGVVCGAKYSDDAVVVHDFSETIEGLRVFMGSKYSQSDIRGIYKKIKDYLRTGRLVLFTGTPCQVHGLQLYLRKQYENLITLDLVCHAVPSPKIFKEYIDFCSKKLGGKVNSIDMRYKLPYGWSHKFVYRFNLENGKHIVDPTDFVNWGRLFFSKLIDRPSCHECKYTNYNRCGDLTIADFWDDNNLRPDIRSVDGTSLCLVNTEKGLKILNEIHDFIVEWDITKEESFQPCLDVPTSKNIRRDIFWEDYYKKGFEYVYKKYFKPQNKQIIKNKIKKILRRFYFG